MKRNKTYCSSKHQADFMPIVGGTEHKFMPEDYYSN